MDFSQVKNIVIPDGNVTKIEKDGVKLWEAEDNKIWIVKDGILQSGCSFVMRHYEANQQTYFSGQAQGGNFYELYVTTQNARTNNSYSALQVVNSNLTTGNRYNIYLQLTSSPVFANTEGCISEGVAVGMCAPMTGVYIYTAANKVFNELRTELDLLQGGSLGYAGPYYGGACSGRIQIKNLYYTPVN